MGRQAQATDFVETRSIWNRALPQRRWRKQVRPQVGATWAIQLHFGSSKDLFGLRYRVISSRSCSLLSFYLSFSINTNAFAWPCLCLPGSSRDVTCSLSVHKFIIQVLAQIVPVYAGFLLWATWRSFISSTIIPLIYFYWEASHYITMACLHVCLSTRKGRNHGFLSVYPQC